MVTTLDTFTSLLAGCTIFGILGKDFILSGKILLFHVKWFYREFSIRIRNRWSWQCRQKLSWTGFCVVSRCNLKIRFNPSGKFCTLVILQKQTFVSIWCLFWRINVFSRYFQCCFSWCCTFWALEVELELLAQSSP